MYRPCHLNKRLLIAERRNIGGRCGAMQTNSAVAVVAAAYHHHRHYYCYCFLHRARGKLDDV
jgi:hypothetical protein